MLLKLKSFNLFCLAASMISKRVRYWIYLPPPCNLRLREEFFDQIQKVDPCVIFQSRASTKFRFSKIVQCKLFAKLNSRDSFSDIRFFVSVFAFVKYNIEKWIKSTCKTRKTAKKKKKKTPKTPCHAWYLC